MTPSRDYAHSEADKLFDDDSINIDLFNDDSSSQLSFKGTRDMLAFISLREPHQYQDRYEDFMEIRSEIQEIDSRF